MENSGGETTEVVEAAPLELWSGKAEQLSIEVPIFKPSRFSEKKPVEIVYMFPLKGRITFVQKKTWVLMHDYAVKQGLLDATKARARFRCLVTDLLRDADYDSNDYDYLRTSIESNLETRVAWGPSARDKEGNRRVWQATTLLADAKFISIRNRLYLDWSYSDVLVEQLRAQGAWLKLSTDALRQARTMNGLSLYMVCERFRTNHNGLSDKWAPDVWSSTLSGNASDSSKFQYKYWKRDTLLPAIAEVNSFKAGFSVSFIEERRGRRVLAVQLVIKDEKKQVAAEDCLTEPRQDLLERVLACGVTEAKARRAMRGEPVEVLSAAIASMEARNRTGKIKAPGAYFEQLLQLAKQGELSIKEEASAGQPATESKSVNPKDQLQGIRQAFLASNDCAKAYFNSLPARDQDEIIDLFRHEVVAHDGASATLKSSFAKNPRSAIVASHMWNWLAKRGFKYEPSDKEVMDFGLAHGLLKALV